MLLTVEDIRLLVFAAIFLLTATMTAQFAASEAIHLAVAKWKAWKKGLESNGKQA